MACICDNVLKAILLLTVNIFGSIQKIREQEQEKIEKKAFALQKKYEQKCITTADINDAAYKLPRLDKKTEEKRC